jgi:hypothetical protein
LTTTARRPEKRSRTINGVANTAVWTNGVTTTTGVATTVGAATVAGAVTAALVQVELVTAGVDITAGAATNEGTKLVTATVGTNGVTKAKLLKCVPTTACVIPQAGADATEQSDRTRASKVLFTVDSPFD